MPACGGRKVKACSQDGESLVFYIFESNILTHKKKLFRVSTESTLTKVLWEKSSGKTRTMSFVVIKVWRFLLLLGIPTGVYTGK